MTNVSITDAKDVREQIDPDAAVVPVRHWGRLLLSVVVALLVLQVFWSFATNPFIHWEVVASFLLAPTILKGLLATLEISVIAVVLSTVIAVVVAVMRMSKSVVLSTVAFGYVFVFRGIPLIVLLILVGNIGLFMKQVSLGIPFTDITFFSAPTNRIFTPFVASIIGLSLCASAYMSEIVRGGLLSIGRGQYQAAMALGMDGRQTLRYILLPQAMRVIVPPMGNEFITTIKMSALVAVIAGGDLLTVAQSISGVNYRTIEMLFVATFWYLAVVAASSIIQHFVERFTAEK
ncbi:amino acid ABC transporter permease [Psychromarinibacter sp. C21-152]|uniref:Amino acid ABC transporter permease n=1 Tax=Psychromarinibacter sediminicola TaxID=3033385 RepID=A0AAE3NQN4_9RHOB|nr:amino acid ABC transporter permease [Psychromarinibacter sediminicola]MDF0602448.1 amino acid ABC transporter permease [Psychromarinibacter sediminicola]